MGCSAMNRIKSYINKNLRAIVQSYVNGDGGETLSKNYDDRLMDVYTILMRDFSRTIKVSTHSDHANLLYKEFSDAFKLKFADVKKAGSLANEFNQEELVREII